MIVHCVCQQFKPQYTLWNKDIILKHYYKNFNLEFHRPIGTFHLPNLDLKHKYSWIYKLLLSYFVCSPYLSRCFNWIDRNKKIKALFIFPLLFCLIYHKVIKHLTVVSFEIKRLSFLTLLFMIFLYYSLEYCEWQQLWPSLW